MKREILKQIEDLREGLEADHRTRKRLRIEKLKINGEALKIQKLLTSNNALCDKDFEELKRCAELLDVRVEELKELHRAVELDIKAKERKFNALIAKFSEIDGTEIYPFEVLKMLEKSSQSDWRIEWIQSYEGSKLGYAFVRDDDESYNKRIVADYSLSNDTVYIENSPSRKIVYAGVKFDANDVVQSWDWMEFYLYAVVGIWKNETIKELYDEFIERDYDFAEYVCSLIRENFMKTDEETFREVVGK